MVKVCICVSVCAVFIVAAAFAQDIFPARDGSVRNIDARGAVIEPGGSYLATRSVLYEFDNKSGSWREVFSLPPSGNEMTCVESSGGYVFAGTTSGLYRSKDRGRSWKRIFRSILPWKSNILFVECPADVSGKILIGTSKGIYLSMDFGNRWHDIGDNLRSGGFHSAIVKDGCIYACASKGLHRRKVSDSGWDMIFNAMSQAEEMEETEDDELEDTARPAAGSVATDGRAIYYGIENKIFISHDDGASWHKFPDDGLAGRINRINIFDSPVLICCATTAGAFFYDEGSKIWREAYKGLNRRINVNEIIRGIDTVSSIWLVASSGLYKLEDVGIIAAEVRGIGKDVGRLKMFSDGEPDYASLRQSAIKYGDVSPDKIRNWHIQSRLRALFPKVSFGVDRNLSTTAEIYTSATKDYVISGPDDITKGIDLSVSWDLGNLIWGTEQTSIDMRSRLNTQLRNDILDSLRRAYHERQRLKMEMITNPSSDIKMHTEKELRIAELTHEIDDLTGNYLTDNIAGGN